MENASLIVSCFACRANGDSKLKSETTPKDSFQLQESNDSLRILKRASVRNHIFQSKHFCLDLRETLITWYSRLYFGNRAFP